MVSMRFCFAATLLLALAGIAGAEETPESETVPKPIFTRQGRFAIPFRIETPAANVSPPTKIRLFVSENEGRNWHLEGEVSPAEKGFDFRSAHDGEYWFTIRSVDAQGHSYPEGAYDPQLRVIVDTLAPRLELRAERGIAAKSLSIGTSSIRRSIRRASKWNTNLPAAPGRRWPSNPSRNTSRN